VIFYGIEDWGAMMVYIEPKRNGYRPQTLSRRPDAFTEVISLNRFSLPI